MPDLALGAFRILEIGDFISSAYAGRFLTGLGAEVIKVEPPCGDELRRFGPFPGDAPNPEKSGAFLYYHAGKLGVTLNPRAPTGRDLLLRLAAQVDGLVTNYPPTFWDELGVSYADLARENPGLVMVAISPFGWTGPYRDYKAYEITCWHGSGAAHRYMGEPGEQPLRGAFYQADHWGGANAAAAMLLAWHQRADTGRGQFVDVSETEALATLYVGYNNAAVFFHTGEVKSRGGNRQQGGAPAALLPCKDGFVYIFTPQVHMWEGLKRAMGDPDWAKDPLFQGTYAERGRYADEMYALMSDWLMEHTKQEIFMACQTNKAPCTPVSTMADLAQNEHLRARGYFVPLGRPETGEFEMPGAPFKLPATPWRIERPAPLLGEHNAEVYCGRLGLSARDLAALRRCGVV